MNAKMALAGALTLMSLLGVGGCGGGGGGGEALLVTSGGGAASVSTPNLVGQSQTAAVLDITNAGLTVGVITPQNSTTVASGTVMSQYPAAGAMISKGTVVIMTVSAGPPAGGGLTLRVLTPLPASETTPPGGGLTTTAAASYVVFAWNDLGMHCLNPSYDTAVILPPYNTVRAQVVRRGNKPAVITSGVTVSYRIINNTTSKKESFAQFWTFAQQLFNLAAPLKQDYGLNLDDPNVSNTLTGTMLPKTGYFNASGIPVTPVNDGGTWTPYQMIEVTVKDGGGNTLAQTRTTIPTSDEINCGKCHPTATSSDPKVVFQDILAKHDARQGTTLLQDANNSKPVLCAKCHGSPALGMPLQPGIKYLSEAIHGFHANDPKVTTRPSCYDCHPGSVTQCNRSTHHTAADGNCTQCHGSLATVASSITTAGGGRVPWVSEPKCATCHAGVAQVDTGATLYRNSDTGHGGLFCTACHGSPHAMTPSGQITDNYQSIQYQGNAMAIGDCRACHEHRTSRGGGSASEFSQKHGAGGRTSACNVCHTGFQNASDTTKWPHQFQWKSR